MELDLRFNFSIDPKLNTAFNSTANQCRSDFNNYIGSLSEGFESNIDWWVLSPPSRNTYASPLFHYFCCINFLTEALDENEFQISTILVDSKELKLLIDEIKLKKSKEDISVIYCPPLNLKIKRFFSKFASYEVNYLYRIFRFFISRLICFWFPKQKALKELVLLDTFINKDHINNDRWYGVLWDSLKQDQKDKMLFVPSIINTKFLSVFSLFFLIKKNKKNMILKDDFLSIKDINFCYLHKYRRKKLHYSSNLLGLDLTKLITEEITFFRDTDSIFESLSSYRFLSRIKDEGFTVELAYDWFEGQSLDKAWSLGLRTFHKNARQVGYRAFFKSYPFYLSTYPIESEAISGVLPDAFVVPGKGALKDLKEFYPSLDAKVIPAFKATHVWSCIYNETIRKQILVTLPISVPTSQRIINQLVETNNFLRKKGYSFHFILKTHPTISIKEIKKELKFILPSEFKFTKEQSFPKLLKESSVLITEASSTSLEALACGISVIIIFNETGLTYDPIPEDIPESMFRKVNGVTEINLALEYFINRNREDLNKQNKFAKVIRESYFEPISEEGIDNFFNA